MEWIYKGYRGADGFVTRVTVEAEGQRPKLLKPSKLAQQKSPTGYEWSYFGSGPAALAHTILEHELGSLNASRYFTEFKRDVIGILSARAWLDEGEHPDETHEWTLTSRMILDWFHHKQQEVAA